MIREHGIDQGKPRVARLLAGSLGILLVVYVAQVASGIDSPLLAEVFDKWVYNALLIGSAVCCTARGLAVRAERGPWLVLGLALALWACGDLYYTLFQWNDEVVPFPSAADGFWLAFYPVSYVALGLLLRRRLTRFHGNLWLDGLIGALTVTAVGAALVFDAVLETTGGSPLVVMTNLAYPLFDLLLLAMLVGLVALAGWRLDRTWGLIAAGFLSFALADSVYLYQTAKGTYVEGTLLDTGWPIATVLLAFAAWQPPRKLGEIRDAGWRALTLPAAFAFVGLSLLVYDHFQPLNTLAFTLAVAALAAVIVRAVLAFREHARLLVVSREEALTDSLTNLGNRRRFMADLKRDLAGNGTAQPLVLVLFDLDGFKSYNDMFGHPAGDRLLSRLARNLARAVESRGRAYRMGGDEFCVLVPTAETEPGELIDTVTAALTEEGEGFSVTCSYGSVSMPDEAEHLSEALRLADSRMYVHKHRHRPTAGRQSMAVLLRVLGERDSDLGEHLGVVADLAEAVGRRLHVSPEQLETMRQAAEAHDVGKLAIPEEILTKPGPLTEDEWDFVKRHTLIGERILSAAPALGSAAKIVRSTHERWDGAGYPDGLAAHAIPLGARIIAVCDAFDAMTTPRPHAAAITPREALRELLRGAGTQFDPEVVDAFAAIQAEVHADLVA